MELCWCCRFIAIGLILLTLAYIGMVVLLKFFVSQECLDPCNSNSEGVDNTILQWSSDFFVSLFCVVFALHLSLVRASVQKSAILAQIFMGGAFALSGIGSWIYPNSGLDDNGGMLGFWIVWTGSSIFFAISGLAMAHFALSVTLDLYPVEYNSCCATTSRLDRRPISGCCYCLPHPYLVACCEILLALSLSAFLTGAVWCSVSEDLQVATVVDDLDATSEINTCLTILYYTGHFALPVTYALLWFPVGCLLRAACLHWPQTILGLPTHVAAGMAMVLQWTVGAMFPVYWIVTAVIYETTHQQQQQPITITTTSETFLELGQRVYGSVIYHWGMLLTMYCLHNLSLGLPEWCLEEEEKDQELDEEQEEEEEEEQRHRHRQKQQNNDDDDVPTCWTLEWILCQIGFGPENDPSSNRHYHHQRRQDERRLTRSCSKTVTSIPERKKKKTNLKNHFCQSCGKVKR
jgi:hypothetical protein